MELGSETEGKSIEHVLSKSNKSTTSPTVRNSDVITVLEEDIRVALTNVGWGKAPGLDGACYEHFIFTINSCTDTKDSITSSTCSLPQDDPIITTRFTQSLAKVYPILLATP